MSDAVAQRRACSAQGSPRARTGRRQGLATAAAFVLVACAAACARGALPKDAHTTKLAARLAQADARRAQELAPDLYARAVRAAEDAQNSRDAAERVDQALRADLLLQAALAEADRVMAERASAERDAQAERAQEQRAEFERERSIVEQAEQRELAATAARDEAQRVFAGGTGADGAGGAAFVRDRAALTLAAAIALGLEPRRAEAIERAIAQLERAPERGQSNATRFAAAERVLSDAERALGQARTLRPGPTPEELAALLATATERGLHAEAVARGVVIGLDVAFTNGSATPSAAGRRLLDALASLVRTHPHGSIQLEARAALDATSRARVERVRALLAGQTDPKRITLTTAAPGSDGAERIQAIFTAYVPGGAKTL